MSWQRGRLGGGYWKFPILSGELWGRGFDLWLLKFPEGCFIIQHKDVVPGKRHYRLNTTLWPAEGGEFRCEEEAILWKWGPFVLFRPDLGLHEQDIITSGTRYILSLGWTRLPAK